MATIHFENWDSFTAGTIQPTGWTNSDAGGNTAVVTSTLKSGPNALGCAAAAPTTVVYSAATDGNGGDCTVSGYLGFDPGQATNSQVNIGLLARYGPTAATAFASSSCYLTEIVFYGGAAGLYLVAQQAGAGTTLAGPLFPSAFDVAQVYFLELSCVGPAIKVRVQRTSDGQWLNSSGSWVTDGTGQTYAVSATDSRVTGAGYAGIFFSTPGAGPNKARVDDVTFASVASSSPLTAGTCSATAASGTTATISGTAATGGTAPYSYRYERSADNAGWTPIGSAQSGLAAGVAPSPYTDSGLAAATWYYRYTVTDSSAGSATTASTSVTLGGPLAIGTTVATKASASSITVSVPAATGGDPPYTAYQYRRSTDGATWTNIGSAQGTNAAYTDSGLSPGTYYYDCVVTDSATPTPATATAATATIVLRTAGAYYVSPSGSDANPGTQAQPWQTIAHANAAGLGAGDSVLLEGGQTFTGNLLLSGIAGTRAAPITVGSYGTGRATIAPGNGYAVRAVNCSGLVIRDLIVAGSGISSTGNHTSTNAGIEVLNTATSGQKKGVTIDNIDVTGCYSGVEVRGHSAATTGPGSGFSEVRISRVNGHDLGSINVYVRTIPLLNASGQAITWDQFSLPTTVGTASNNYLIHNDSGNAARDHNRVYVEDCHSYNVYGDLARGDMHSGDGIILREVQHGRVERCTHHDSGQHGFGPAGIWFQEATDCIARYCAVWRQHSGQAPDTDADGFDMDGGCIDCHIDSCISAWNDGAAFLCGPYPASASPIGCSVRHCWSIDDDQVGNHSTFYPYGGQLAAINNTIVKTRAGSSASPIFKDGMWAILNNVLITSGGVPFVVDNQSAAIFGNLYYATDGDWQAKLGGTTYTSLAAWAAAGGFETLDGLFMGLDSDPQMPGATTFPGSVTRTVDLTGPDPAAGSPVIGSGLDVMGSYPQIPVAVVDFHGDPARGQATADHAGYDRGAVKADGAALLASPTTNPTTRAVPLRRPSRSR